jgi:hypothetical protein
MAADTATFNTYFTKIELGVMSVTTISTTPVFVPTTAFRTGDTICVRYAVIKGTSVAVGIYNPATREYVQPRTDVTPALPVGNENIRCGDLPTPSAGSYEYHIWVGDALVAILPFTVR